MEQAAAIDDRMIGQILAIGSERQRIAYLNTVLAGIFTRFCLWCCNTSAILPVPSDAALDLVLRRKAIAAEALATQRDALLGGKYPALEPQLRELAALRMQIARKTLAGPGPEGTRVSPATTRRVERPERAAGSGAGPPDPRDEPGAEAPGRRPPRRGPEPARGSRPGRVRPVLRLRFPGRAGPR